MYSGHHVSAVRNTDVARRPDCVRMRVDGLRNGCAEWLQQALLELEGVVHAAVDARRGQLSVYQHGTDLAGLRRMVRRSGGIPGAATVYLF
ncbi:MAG TPA: heavy metal-associated domain-containing protein [Gammaproteobacteria bacterium]|nr:heavy metal-associated domain-containing protein [Gammaproteobacteria bacterium]